MNIQREPRSILHGRLNKRISKHRPNMHTIKTRTSQFSNINTEMFRTVESLDFTTQAVPWETSLPSITTRTADRT